MAMQTIWGTVQNKANLCRGVMVIGTASHGGMLLAKGYAEKHLPMELLDRFPFYVSYYCFEEDCDINIPLFFIPELLPKLANVFLPHRTI